MTLEVMKKVMAEMNGHAACHSFNQSVVRNSELVANLSELHIIISQDESEMEKEELFLYVLEELIQAHSDLEIFPKASETAHEIKTVCHYLEENYTKTITLNKLSTLTGWSK